MLLGSERMPAPGAVIRLCVGRGIAGLQPYPLPYTHTQLIFTDNTNIILTPCVCVCVLVCALVFSFCLYVCGCLCASVGVHMVWDAHGVYECAWGGMCGSLWWVNWLDVRVVF